MTMAHVVLKGSLVDLPTGVPADAEAPHSAGQDPAAHLPEAVYLYLQQFTCTFSSSPVRAQALHPAVLPVAFVVIALAECLTRSDEFTKSTQTGRISIRSLCHSYSSLSPILKAVPEGSAVDSAIRPLQHAPEKKEGS